MERQMSPLIISDRRIIFQNYVARFAVKIVSPKNHSQSGIPQSFDISKHYSLLETGQVGYGLNLEY